MCATSNHATHPAFSNQRCQAEKSLIQEYIRKLIHMKAPHRSVARGNVPARNSPGANVKNALNIQYL